MRKTPLRRISSLKRSASLRSQGPGKRKKSARYKSYLSSAAWKRLRVDAIRFWLQPGPIGGRWYATCPRCQAETFVEDMQVHHRTYARFGRERLSDLEVLCRACHRQHHSTADWYKPRRRA